MSPSWPQFLALGDEGIYVGIPIGFVVVDCAQIHADIGLAGNVYVLLLYSMSASVWPVHFGIVITAGKRRSISIWELMSRVSQEFTLRIKKERKTRNDYSVGPRPDL